MKYYKCVFGYGEGDYLSISGDELPKAIAIFMERKGRASFEQGGIDGVDIKRIVPDWHRVMGWNRGRRLEPEDYREVRGYEKAYADVYQRASDIAEYAIKENRRDLLEMPATLASAQVPKMIKGPGVLDTKKLADHFRIPPKK